MDQESLSLIDKSNMSSLQHTWAFCTIVIFISNFIIVIIIIIVINIPIMIS